MIIEEAKKAYEMLNPNSDSSAIIYNATNDNVKAYSYNANDLAASHQLPVRISKNSVTIPAKKAVELIAGGGSIQAEVKKSDGNYTDMQPMSKGSFYIFDGENLSLAEF
jgi:hypothetical protein